MRKVYWLFKGLVHTVILHLSLNAQVYKIFMWTHAQSFQSYEMKTRVYTLYFCTTIEYR